MSPEWESTDLPDGSHGREGPIFDAPAARGYDWEKRSNEIKKRDNNVCQRCGDHNGNYEHHPLVMETHHLVPGKFLPKADARVDLNLVTVCGSCHGRLEGSHIERQFAETDRNEALRVLRILKERERSPYSLSRELELSDERIRSIISQLDRMNCLTDRGSVRYRATCPATAQSVVERTKRHWKRERAKRQRLETELAELQRELDIGLDELEYALESGDRQRLESVLEEIRDACAAVPQCSDR